MKILLAIAALAFLLTACLPKPETLPPGKGSIRLLGRWDSRGAPDRFVAVNPGSSFEFRYEGTTCVLHFDRSANKAPWPQLWVRLDGRWAKHSLDRDRIVLGEGAGLGRHKVWVVLKSAREHQSRWKPPLVASLTLTGVEVPDGVFVRLPRSRRRIFEAIGDSITEGVLFLRRGKPEEWTEIADSRGTYAFQAAVALGCEPRLIGFGAQGLTRAGNGGVPPAGLAYPFVYEGAPADEPPADIVTILHGSNDSKVPHIESVYTNFARLVRRRNAQAAIFCVIPFNQIHARSIRGAVDTLRGHGDAMVFLVETRDWIDPKTDATDGVHPNAQGHAKAARKLAAFIRHTVGR